MTDLWTDTGPSGNGEVIPVTDAVRKVDDVTGAVEGLRQVLDENEELGVVLHRCCRQATHAIPDADHAGIMLLRDGKPFTAVVTDDVVHALDEPQYRTGCGPCLLSADTGQVVRVTVAESADRWPEFARVARDAGIGTVLSAPLFLDQDYQGALNLYGRDPRAMAELEVALLELYTAAAEAALAAELRYRTAREHTEQLHGALTSRAVIDQAKGIIMAARQVNAEAAFAALVERSQRENRKLREVAEEFVANAATQH